MATGATSELEIVGRDAELAALDEFVAHTGSSRAFVVTGEPGIGKSTLWEAGLDRAARHGVRVLSTRGSGADTRLSFAALIDLLEGVSPEELQSLPSPQRRALEVALFRAAPSGTPPEASAIAVAVLNTLRSLATGGPLLVAIDDIQWLDEASADAVAFAARRLEGGAVGFLLARRPGAATLVERALGERGLERLDVTPLSLGATRRMLSERLGLTLRRHLLRRVYEATVGNPLFTLEVGRTLVASGVPAVGDDLPVPDLVEDLLGSRVAQLAPPARRLLLALALNADLRASQLRQVVEPSAIEDAVVAGVVVLEGERLRPSHPLLAAAAKNGSRASERRDLHRELAGVVADPELRALHLALATQQPDAELAATVAAAAAGAAARGAVHQAVELAEHALRLTPPRAAERYDRVLALAAHLSAISEPKRVTELLAPEVESLPPGSARARAWMILAGGGVVSGNEEIRRHLERALEESWNDPILQAQALVRLAENTAVIRVEQLATAEAWALEALPAARSSGPAVERVALYMLSWPRALRGRPIADLCERFNAVADVAFSIGSTPERVAGQRLVWRGEIDAARELLTRLRSLADERGEPYAYALMRLHVCELELRVGAWDAAERLLDEWAESAERELMIWPMYERCRALLAVGRGDPAGTETWAREAIARAERVGVRWDLLESQRALGAAALLAHEPGRAAEHLRAVWEYVEREGVDDRGAFPAAPDLVEALTELGEPEEAQGVARRLRALAEEQAHPWGLATARRCDALVRLTSERDDEEALAELARAADEYAALGLRFDATRTLLSAGRAHRRVKKWGAARDTLERAAAEFDELGSPGWAEEARSELTRVGGRRPQQAGELTPAERRVAELAADGLANKEIAQSLFVTVRTVEVHLKHVYAKLGIRSRTQLARRLSEPE